MPNAHNAVGLIKVRLGALGHLRGGYVGPNAAVDRPTASGLRALQASDIGPRGIINWSALRWANPIRDGERYTVADGDVLLPLRSTRPLVTIVHKAPPGVVAAGHWAVLSPNTGSVEAAFLAWYLNHPRTRARLTQIAQGTNIQFLSLNAVRDFEIELPSLDVQRRIALVHTLHVRVRELEQQLKYARSEFIDAATMDILREHHPNDS